MRHWLVLASLLGALAGSATAQDSAMRSLETGVDGRAWEAVGRLDIAGRGFCSGALIAPDLVLTAAHCLFDKTTGNRIDHGKIEFRAGWRNGRASAYRDIKRVVLHPEYTFGDLVLTSRVRNDVALLQLMRPIQNTTVRPFATSTKPLRGDSVAIVSYARDRSEAPSLQQVCDVLGVQSGVLVTSCTVDYGASGAPIFAIADGVAQIVSVVSAKAEVGDQEVSLGTDLQAPLRLLRAELAADGGYFTRADPNASPVTVGQDRRTTGAKFIRLHQ